MWTCRWAQAPGGGVGRAGGAMKCEPAGWLAPFCGRVASVPGRLAGASPVTAQPRWPVLRDPGWRPGCSEPPRRLVLRKLPGPTQRAVQLGPVHAELCPGGLGVECSHRSPTPPLTLPHRRTRL